MILHIVEEEKFLNKIIEIFEDICPGKNIFLVGINSNNQKFKYLDKKKEPYVIYSTIGTKDYIEKFEKLIANTSLFFFHNLYKAYKFNLFKIIPLQKKVAWFFWGAELYGMYPGKKMDNLLPLTKKIYYSNLPLSIHIRKRILSKIKKAFYWNKFRKILQQRVDFMLSNIDEDLDLLLEYIPTKAKKGWFTYFTIDTKDFEYSSKLKQNILIGNSSSSSNNHFDAFEMLKGKNIEGRKIVVPLNYGDPFYAKLVLKNMYKTFGKQAFPIIDFLPLQEYNNLINSCSVLIMNHKRQQAFNTIMLAISNGCKVFLRRENTIYQYLKAKGFIVFSIEESFNKMDALESLSNDIQVFNVKLVKKYFSYSSVIACVSEQISKIIDE